jgi:uncharacterized protein involved in response to NO
MVPVEVVVFVNASASKKQGSQLHGLFVNTWLSSCHFHANFLVYLLAYTTWFSRPQPLQQAVAAACSH